MGLFLLRFWPVLIPLLIYIVWMFSVRRRAKKMGEKPPHFRDGPLFWVVVSSLLIAVVMFVWIGLSHPQNRGDYVPPHMENGRIVPGAIEAP